MGALERRARRQTGKLGHVPDEVHAGHVSNEGIILRHIADCTADLGSIPLHIEPEDSRGSFRRRMKSQQSVDQRGFSRAVGTEQPDGITLQLSCEPVQHGAGSKPNFQPIEINHAHVTLLRSRQPACSRNESKFPESKSRSQRDGYRWLPRSCCPCPMRKL